MLTLIRKHIPQKVLSALIMLLGALFFSSAIAEGQSQQGSSNILGSAGSESLTELQKQARLYRSKGYQLQNTGDLDSALSWYQKAVEIDPLYALAFNDLGIIYESKGMLERAEECYLKALSIDPNMLSVYSNLGYLYESRRDLKTAVSYWDKRVKLGSEYDPWTQKARRRLRDILLILGESQKAEEQEALAAMKRLNAKKAVLRENDQELAKEYLEQAKRSYAREDLAAALKQATSAQQLDPTNMESAELIEKVQLRALSR